MLEYHDYTCSRISMSPRPIRLGQDHPRDLHRSMDLLRRWLRAKRVHRLCHLDTPTASCVEPEDGYNAKGLGGWYTHVGLTVSYRRKADVVKVEILTDGLAPV